MYNIDQLMPIILNFIFLIFEIVKGSQIFMANKLCSDKIAPRSTKQVFV
jgi:hypothetical protein